MKRKAITAVGAVAAYGASIHLMGMGYNDNLLAVLGILASVAIALMLMQWSRA